jgi:hypothetical protein
MQLKANDDYWKPLILNFSFYEGTLKDFCSENNIRKNQFYYYRK